MGHKNVCFECKKAFNIGTDVLHIKESNCPDCGGLMVFLNQKFRPPKKTDNEAWKTAHFLVENGFPFQHIYDDDITPTYVPYPTTLGAARKFVEKYKSQRIDSQ